MGLSPVTGVVMRRENRNQRQTPRRQGCMKTEAETGVTHLQAKEFEGCWPPPEARRDRRTLP